MKPSDRAVIICRFAAVTAFLLIACLGFSDKLVETETVSASVDGPSPSHTNAPGEGNCTACHVDYPLNDGTGELKITGIPANYLPGQQVPVTVTLNQPEAVAFGFQMTAIDQAGLPAGSFVLPDLDPQPLQVMHGFVAGILRDYIEHTFNGVTRVQFGTKSWNFVWTAPAVRAGKISFYAAGNAADSSGTSSGDRIFTTSAAARSGSAISNFDKDGNSDIAVFRPSNGTWYARTSGDNGFQIVNFGQSGDQIVPGDYDGDGSTDKAVWRPSTGTWYILNTGGFFATAFGVSGDIPVPGDYDGDLKNDLAVWRPSTGIWYILRSSDGGFISRSFGVSGDLPVQADFDGDAKTDIAVYRPSTGFWYFVTSSNGGFSSTNFGIDGDRPVQSDYDGDGRCDIAVFRPANQTWYVVPSTGGFTATNFGAPGDMPVPADFDGDGRTDIAVYRSGTWFILGTVGPSFYSAEFGIPGDIPIPKGYLAN